MTKSWSDNSVSYFAELICVFSNREEIKAVESILFGIEMSRMLWHFFGKTAAVMSNLDAYEGVCLLFREQKGMNDSVCWNLRYFKYLYSHKMSET